MAQRKMLHQPMERLWSYAKTVDEALDALGEQVAERDAR
jgi:hypothetical protein